MVSKTTNTLIEQEDALGAFFESLMRDVEAYAEHETATTPVQTQAVAEAEKPIPPMATPAPHPRLVSAT